MKTTVAWTLAAVCLAAAAANVVLTLGPGGDSLEADSGQLVAVLLPLGFLTFPTVGALIVAKTHGNRIGWILLTAGLVFALGAAASTYSGVSPSLPGHRYSAWLMHWTIQSPGFFSVFTFLLLLFPTGSTLGPRWTWVARISGTATAAFVLLVAFKPGQLAESPLDNPVGVAWVAPLWDVLELPLFAAIMLSVLASALSIVIRFRGSRGTERQQIKWFVFAAVLIAGIVAVAPIVFAVPALWWVWPILFLIGTTSVPVAIGIAILRYRLYDIDRIISRTVTYAIVTAVLVGVYSLIAVVLPSFVLGGNSSDAVIAAGTLGAAAAFGPVRRVVQTRVDRRFNRARYDAAGTVAQFTARLREQVDLDALSVMLEAAVDRTVQPAHLFLWVRSRSRDP